MGMKVGSCLHLSQPTVPHSPSSQTPASVISLLEQKTKPSSSSSSSSTLKSRCFGDYSTLVWGSASSSNRSSLFGTGPPSSNKLLRTRSYGTPKNRGTTSLRRSCSASLSNLFDEDEEFSKTLDELSLRFEVEESSEAKSIQREGETGDNGENFSHFVKNRRPFVSRLNLNSVPPWLESRPEPPDWPVKMTNPVSLEIRANSVELPLSLRMIKRKQWYERATSLEEGFSEAGETACCSVKKAFSSMVFMIRELQSFTLRMRQFLFYEDLQEILVRVQKEMQASFVWLFQQVFSCTPTLMVYVMILLANFTVYSMGKNTAFASAPPPESYAAAVEVVESRRTQNPKLKSKDFSVSAGKFNVSGDGGGSGGKSAVVAGSADGDGQFDQSYGRHRSFFNDEASPVSSVGNPIREAGEEAVAAWEEEEEWDVLNVSPSEQLKDELKLWNRVVEEASRMQACSRDESLDDETIQMLVSPVAAEMEREDYDERYFRTELLYQQAIANEPDNPLLLCNYAQFLFLAVHDHDRAEEYFKRAVRVYPPDAESLDRYANFLWLARKDLTAAEETFLAAIEAEPGNTFHAANYAHFLWNTGGEDTCFPLDSA